MSWTRNTKCELPQHNVAVICDVCCSQVIKQVVDVSSVFVCYSERERLPGDGEDDFHDEHDVIDDVDDDYESASDDGESEACLWPCEN